MGLDVWFKEDVQRCLRAAQEAMQHFAQVMPANAMTDAYLDGYEAALRIVGEFFGVTLPPPGEVQSPVIIIHEPNERRLIP